ncbi:MAG: redoxin domain-containing protein [Kiloniellales bacterium]|nr:redoxin domain-containing protein [Kiloniellales bacterium]
MASFVAVPLLLLLPALGGCDDLAAGSAGPGVDWPPRLGEAYPDLELTNYDGRKIRLSDFKGKVVLVEPVGMNCEACNAFAGAHRRGAFAGIRPQPGLESIEDYIHERLDGLTVDYSDLVLVHLLLYDLFMEAPDAEDARIWAEHFGFDREPNVYVVFSARDLRGRASHRMIPGFQLLDSDSVLRADSTGHRPRHDLYAELLPMIPRLLDE